MVFWFILTQVWGVAFGEIWGGRFEARVDPGRERSVSSSMCYMDTRPAASRPSGPEERTQAAEAARCPEKSTLKGAEGLCVRGTLRVWLTH